MGNNFRFLVQEIGGCRRGFGFGIVSKQLFETPMGSFNVYYQRGEEFELSRP